jgi:hypothetical protein
MIRVLYYRIPREAELPDLQPLIAQLPEALQQKVQTYRFWKDQALNLFGKLMLASALQALTILMGDPSWRGIWILTSAIRRSGLSVPGQKV